MGLLGGNIMKKFENIVRAIGYAFAAVAILAGIFGFGWLVAESSKVEAEVVSCVDSGKTNLFNDNVYNVVVEYKGVKFDTVSYESCEVGEVIKTHLPHELEVVVVACGNPKEELNGFALSQSTMYTLKGNYAMGVLYSSMSRSKSYIAIVEYEGEQYAVEVSRNYKAGKTLYISAAELTALIEDPMA
jgi:hypothetical protein